MALSSFSASERVERFSDATCFRLPSITTSAPRSVSADFAANSRAVAWRPCHSHQARRPISTHVTIPMTGSQRARTLVDRVAPGVACSSSDIDWKLSELTELWVSHDR